MNNFAYLKADCGFADLFPDRKCPIINIVVPNLARLEDVRSGAVGIEEVFMVDIGKVGAMRLEEIARRIAERSKSDPALVLTEILERGLPLRASQTEECETDVPFFL
jgi:hypothetical protein